MDLETLMPILLVALLSVLGNVMYFKYQFKKQNKYSILHKQLTDLLLPIFFVFQENSLESKTWSKHVDYDPVEDQIVAPRKILKKVIPIIKDNLYLADDELHTACIQFLEWSAKFNETEAFQKAVTGFPDLTELDKFQEVIERSYKSTKE